jgi:hypothetical protein
MFSAKLLFIPTGYWGTRSAELYAVGGVLMTSSPVPCDVLSTEWKFRHNISETVNFTPAVSIIVHDYRIVSLYSGGTMAIGMRSGYCHAGYFSHMRFKKSLSHELSCSFTMNRFKLVEPTFDIGSKYKNDQQFELYGNISTEIMLKEGLKINPFFLYRKSHAIEETYTCGLSQTLTLFKSTYSDIRVENVFGKSETEGGAFRVKAKMWFLF